MNQRIFELAKTSGAWDYFNDGDKSAIMDQQALQNFAELIVRECAELADNQEDYLTAKIIKKHFGVEE